MNSAQATGAEIAVLCRMSSLLHDLPGTAQFFHELYDVITNAIDHYLDADMAVDPIEHAMRSLSKDGHIDGLEELVFSMLRRRNDEGQWRAIINRMPVYTA